MYSFNITGIPDGTYYFKLDGITIITHGYTVENSKHRMKQAARSIAFFMLNGFLYSIANNTRIRQNVEDLYEQLRIQYTHFLPGNGNVPYRRSDAGRR